MELSGNCLKILAEEWNTYKVAIISVSSSASVGCVLVIIFIMVSKRYIRSLFITLYLIIAAILELALSIVDVLPVYRDETVVAVTRGYSCWFYCG